MSMFTHNLFYVFLYIFEMTKKGHYNQYFVKNAFPFCLTISHMHIEHSLIITLN
jgi:hypothetical protein